MRDPLDVAALDANRAFSMFQLGLSVIRLTHTGGSMLYLRLYGGDMFERGNSDGSLSEDGLAPRYVFEVKARCANGVNFSEPTQQLVAPLASSSTSQRQVPQLPLCTASTTSHPRLTTPASTAQPIVLIASVVCDEVSDVEDEEEDVVLPLPNPKRRIAEGGRSIIDSLLDNHRGHNPMVLPYERLFNLSDNDDDTEEMV